MEKPKIRLLTRSDVHVVGLSQTGGCWLPTGRFTRDYSLAKELVEFDRATGGHDKVFTLTEFVRDIPAAPKQGFDNPEADKLKTVTVSKLISYLEREMRAHGDVDVRICLPYADGIGFRLPAIKDVHYAEGRIDILTNPED
jgi:hypothetical protein